MSSKTDVWQGTLALMVLKTLERTGSLHGYGIARQIEQTSEDLLSVNYGTLYPALLKLEQEGAIASEWGVSDNNRKAKFYQLTRRRPETDPKGNQGMGADGIDSRPVPEPQTSVNAGFAVSRACLSLTPIGWPYFVARPESTSSENL